MMEKKVLNIENLILHKNQIIGFFGPNGSGKSTLFFITLFICKPTKGEILFDDSNKIDSEIKKYSNSSSKSIPFKKKCI